MVQKKSKPKSITENDAFVRSVGLALKRAAKEVRRLAKMHGTNVWYMGDGKLVGEKP